MRYLTVSEVLALHRQLILTSGGTPGVRDLGGLESALAQPRQTFAGEPLHRSVTAKAAALGFSLIANHPFIDGNKRVGHASMEVFLHLNGLEIFADVDDQEAMVMSIASGKADREVLETWLAGRVKDRAT